MGKNIEIKYIEQGACAYAEKHLEARCQERLGHHVCWAVVHPQHAGYPTLHKTKSEADKYKKEHANAYVVCRIAVIPLYGNICQVNESEI